MSANQSFFSEREDFDDLVEVQNEKLPKILQSAEIFTDFFHQEDHAKNNIFLSGFRDCTNVARESLREVLQNVDKCIHNLEIEKRVVPYCILTSLQMSECFLDMAEQLCDSQDVDVEKLEDMEAPKVQVDKWMRGVIGVDSAKLAAIGSNSQKIPQESDRESQSSKQSHMTRWKKTSMPGQIKSVGSIMETPSPVNMEKPQEFDEFEERIRVIKQIEYKRKAEMEQQEQLALQEIKRQQQSMKNEIKGQKFTYDFDGKIINTKNIITDKLPPTNYLVQFQLRDEITKSKQIPIQTAGVIGQEDKKPIKGGQKESIDMSQPQQARRESMVKQMDKLKTVSSPFEYESFVPSNGVKLIYQTRFKEGNKYNPEIYDLEQLDLILRTHKESEPLHITKSDYRKLTENGNLNRNTPSQSLSNIPPNTSTPILKLEHKNNSIINNIINTSSLNNSRGIGGSDTNRPIDLSSALKNPKDSSRNIVPGRKTNSLHSLNEQKIKITNMKLAHDLVFLETHESSETDRENYAKQKLPKIMERNKSTNNLKASPNDEFNMKLMEDQNWGKGRGGTYYPHEQTLSKPSLNDYKKSLNSLYQFPRERDRLSVAKKAQKQQIQEQIQQSVRHLHSNKNLALSTSQDFFSTGRQTFYSSRSVFENQLRSTQNGQF